MESRSTHSQGESPFDTFADKYDAWFEREGKPVFEVEVRAFQEVLASLPKPWVEIGVGSGRFAAALGIETGIDPSASLGKMAENRGIKVIRGRGEDELFPKGFFGTAFIIVTICFVEDPTLVLKRTADMLEDSGKLVLGLITLESPWARYYMKKKEEGHPFYGIAEFYGYSQILNFLKDGGFLHERTVSTLFQKPDHVDKMEPPLDDFSPEAGFIVVVARKEK